MTTRIGIPRALGRAAWSSVATQYVQSMFKRACVAHGITCTQLAEPNPRAPSPLRAAGPCHANGSVGVSVDPDGELRAITQLGDDITAWVARQAHAGVTHFIHKPEHPIVSVAFDCDDDNGRAVWLLYRQPVSGAVLDALRDSDSTLRVLDVEPDATYDVNVDDSSVRRSGSCA